MDETQGAQEPESGIEQGAAPADPIDAPAAVPVTAPSEASPDVQAPTDNAGPAVIGADIWAENFMTLLAANPADITLDGMETWFTNCLRDGFYQGQAAGPKGMTPTEAYLRAKERFEAEHPRTLRDRLEDDVLRAAEETAYSVSNLLASASGRTPDNDIDAWRKRTGGLWRHTHVA
jgi:hypothetical protein